MYKFYTILDIVLSLLAIRKVAGLPLLARYQWMATTKIFGKFSTRSKGQTPPKFAWPGALQNLEPGLFSFEQTMLINLL